MSQIPVTRNEIFDGVLAYAKDKIAWGSGKTFVGDVSRKWREPSESDELPCLYQVEPVEAFAQIRGLEYKRKFEVLWLIYTRSDPGDKTSIPAAEQSDILDAVQAALTPDGPELVQTLGGLVHHAWISDIVHKVSGDDTGLGLLIVPVSIEVP